MKSQIIAHGAEALIVRSRNRVIKQRIKKGYRLPQIDEKLRKQRTRKELRLLDKAHQLIPVPGIIKYSDYDIELEEIKGRKLSEYFESLSNSRSVCTQIGQNIAKLHDTGLIHGDLTTSNMIYVEKEKKVYFIDFGLGFESSRAEDKAVDLHVLKEALDARHFNFAEKFWKAILEGYKASKKYKETLARLEKVERRGRYKTQY